MRFWMALILLAFLFTIAGGGANEPLPAVGPPKDADEQLLHAAGIQTDDATLLALLRKGSEHDPVRQAITRSIQQLGAKTRKERDQAGKMLIAIGALAVPELREAAKDGDLEVARRAASYLKQLGIPEEPEIDPTDQNRSAAELAIRAMRTRLPGHLAAMRILLQRGKGKEVADVCRSTLLTMDESMCAFVETLLEDSLLRDGCLDKPNGLFSLAQCKVLRPHVKAVIEAIEKDSGSSDATVRKGARATLTRWDWYEAPKRLSELLKPREPRQWDDAWEVWIRRKAPLPLIAKRVAPVILEGLKHTDTRVREHAAILASDMRLEAQQLIAELISLFLYEDNEDIRDYVRRALEGFDEDARGAAPVLTRAMKEHKGNVAATRAAIALALIAPDDESPIPWLIEGVGRREEEAWAAYALACYGPKAKSAVPVLFRLAQLQLKEDPSGLANNGRTGNTIGLLGHFGPEAADAVPMLAEMLQADDSGSIGFCAAHALIKLGPAAKGAVPALNDLLKNEELLKSEEGNSAQRKRAIDVLGAIGPEAEAAVPVLMKIFAADASFSIDAGESLVKIGPGAKGAVPALVAVLKDEKAHESIINLAIEILGAIGPAAKEALPSLLELREKTEYKVTAEMAIRRIRVQK